MCGSNVCAVALEQEQAAAAGAVECLCSLVRVAVQDPAPPPPPPPRPTVVEGGGRARWSVEQAVRESERLLPDALTALANLTHLSEPNRQRALAAG